MIFGDLYFQIVLADVDETTEDVSNRFYEAGCGDATPFSSQGVAVVGFARQAHSLDEAIRSAIADVQKAGFSAARMESPDQPVLSRINRELAQR